MIVVEGGVVLESDGVRLRLDATGSKLVARIDGATSLSALRQVRRAAAFARSFVPLLVRSGLTVDVFAGDTQIARAGAGVVANIAARMLDLRNVHLGV